MLTLPSDHEVETAAARLRASLAAPGLDQAVAAYFTEPEFAGVTFTGLGANPPDQITADDLLAVALLDITWRPRVVRVLLETRHAELGGILADIPRDVDLWEASDADLKHVHMLWDALTAIDGIGTASATKLLARKRPRLCPVGDAVVIKAVGVPGRTWDVQRCLLRDPAARADVEALRPPEAGTISLLGILGVALWVSHSQSAAARSARRAAGLRTGPGWP